MAGPYQDDAILGFRFRCLRSISFPSMLVLPIRMIKGSAWKSGRPYAFLLISRHSSATDAAMIVAKGLKATELFTVGRVDSFVSGESTYSLI